MMRRLGISLLFLAIVGCTGKKDIPVALVDGFQSQATIEAAQAKVQQDQKRFQIVEDGTSTRKDAPPYRFTRGRVESFVSQGQQGTLVLEFFNNKLTATSFYPEHLPTYLNGLNAAGIKLSEAQPSTHASGASIELLKDYQGKWYVRWSDPVLMKALQDWLARYS